MMGFMNDRDMSGLDRWITDGYSHYCEFCRTNWCDSDGGCECVFCTECDSRCGYDDLDDDGVCEICVNSSCMWCGEARGIIDINLGTDETLCPSCYGCWLRGEL